jgi:hypothetical protein
MVERTSSEERVNRFPIWTSPFEDPEGGRLPPEAAWREIHDVLVLGGGSSLDPEDWEQEVLKRLRLWESLAEHFHAQGLLVRDIRLEGSHPDTEVVVTLLDEQSGLGVIERVSLWDELFEGSSGKRIHPNSAWAIIYANLNEQRLAQSARDYVRWEREVLTLLRERWEVLAKAVSDRGFVLKDVALDYDYPSTKAVITMSSGEQAQRVPFLAGGFEAPMSDRPSPEAAWTAIYEGLATPGDSPPPPPTPETPPGQE